jgi:hypothetical protein
MIFLEICAEFARGRASPTNLTKRPQTRPNAEVNLSTPSRVAIVLASIVMMTSSPAAALANDLKLQGLVQGSGPEATVRQADFRALSREVGLIFTPSPQAAESTGITGFEIGVDYTFHLVNFEQSYWQDAIEDNGQRLPMTLGLRARKAFVLPIPLLTELEVGSQWLIESQMLSLGGTVRLMLHEGFRYIPDIAVLAGFHRVVGSGDFDLFTAVAGASISKSFGIAGTFSLCPYFSYESIFVNASSSIIDSDPAVSSNTDGAVVFGVVEAASNRIDRLSGGLRFVMANVMVIGGVDVNLAGINEPTSLVIVQPNVRMGVSF